jgi:hypothetical protein
LSSRAKRGISFSLKIQPGLTVLCHSERSLRSENLCPIVRLLCDEFLVLGFSRRRLVNLMWEGTTSVVPHVLALQLGFSRSGSPHLSSISRRTSFRKRIGLLVVVVHREYLLRGILIRIHVHHPPENHRVELPACRLARFLRRNRSMQSEFREIRGAASFFRRYA